MRKKENVSILRVTIPGRLVKVTPKMTAGPMVFIVLATRLPIFLSFIRENCLTVLRNRVEIGNHPMITKKCTK